MRFMLLYMIHYRLSSCITTTAMLLFSCIREMPKEDVGIAMALQGQVSIFLMHTLKSMSCGKSIFTIMKVINIHFIPRD